MCGLHGLALTVVQQPVEIPTSGCPLRLAAEARPEFVEILAQAQEQCARRPCCHARSAQGAADQYKRDRSRRQ